MSTRFRMRVPTASLGKVGGPPDAEALAHALHVRDALSGYVKAALALEAVRKNREDRYGRFIRPLDRKRDELAAEVATRLQALSGGQHAEAQRLLATIPRAGAQDSAASRRLIAR